MRSLLKQCFTDALGRPEPKMMLGVLVLIVAVVYGIWKRDWEGFKCLAGTGLILVGATTVADAKIDHDSMGQSPKDSGEGA